ncbi:unnamed protein product [Paramecium primaurelia]|uniref:Uncharacterized protein n=1 Tax=Paramecium primaurelia TaxID=5886 RepID=A0A8S1KNQ2_PARPR|nr:unnamed protein product [Paramecium primaurelia]
MSSRQCLPKRNKKYQKLTNEERCFIMNMKQQGMGCQEISKILNKNLKTVQSVQSSERKSEYKSLKAAITQYGLDQLLQITSIQSMNDRKLKKLATKIIKNVMPPKNKTKFAHLIPAHKTDSNKRRIIDQIVNNILDNIQKILIIRNMTSLFEPNNSSQGDTMWLDNSEFSKFSSNIIYDESEALDNQYNEGIPNNEYYSDNVPEILQQFEGQSINFLNRSVFEKTIEESSDCYFDL